MARNYPFLLRTVRSSGKGAWETGMPLGSQAHHAPHRMAAARQAIGRFLKSTRQTMRLSQAQVAVLASRNSLPLSRAAISAIERGLHLPSLEALLTYWNALQVDPMEVLERARLATVAPANLSSLSDDQLERRAGELHREGHHRDAAALYDMMLERLAQDPPSDPKVNARRQATVHLQRATALRRAAALLAARSAAERSIAAGSACPDVQAEAYSVLAMIHLQMSNLPLATDAASKAALLSETCGVETRTRVCLSRALVRFEAGEFEEARRALLEARELARKADDPAHLTQIAGSLALCLLALGRRKAARKGMMFAVALARTHRIAALEARWLVELGRIALDEKDLEEALDLAEAALSVAQRRQDPLMIFRAEWLQHQIVLRKSPGDPDRLRLGRLRKLLPHLEDPGEREVQDFRATLGFAQGRRGAP